MNIKALTLTAALMAAFSPAASAANVDAQYEGHSYKVFNNGMTWDEARRYCEQLGGHLVTINSPNEQGLIVGLLRSHGNKNSYWLGGYKNGNDWRWVTGESFSYTNWGQYQPDGDGNALMMYYSTGNGWPSGAWNDLVPDGGTPPFFGTNNFGFVCEWDSSPQVNHDPQGNLENYGTGVGLLRVLGWALDEDDRNHKVRIHLYVGGQAGDSTVPSYEIVANKSHGQYSGHGFDETVSVPAERNGKSFTGWQKIYLYALNDVGAGNWREIGNRDVFIQFKGTAGNTVPAYTNPELNQRNGNERVDRGDEITVVNEQGDAYLVIYPVSNGTKERWVNKHEIFNGGSENIPAKLQDLINRWDGRKWTDGYSRSGNSEKYLNSSAIQCKEFASYVFNILYDTGYIGSGSTSSNYYNWRLNNTPARVYQVAEVPQTNNRNQAREAFRNLFAQAQAGDFIQIKRGSGGAHSAIFVRRTNNGIQWIDANADGANSVRLQTYSYDDLVKTTSKGYQWNVAMSLYRAR